MPPKQMAKAALKTPHAPSHGRRLELQIAMQRVDGGQLRDETASGGVGEDGGGGRLLPWCADHIDFQVTLKIAV